MINGKDILDENKYLKKIINRINTLLSSYINSSKEQDRDIIKHRKYLWDNRNELDDIEINENCGQVAMNEKIYSKKVNRIRTLEKQLHSPYFARLDFKEKDEDSESFYIGISTIEDEENFDILVFDWRSPVSSMFYDFELGPAYYDTPVKRIFGEIELTRQYNIKGNEIVSIHNPNESLCDDALNSILSNNATEKMKNIVSSIQKEQNEIIRSGDSKVLFIQGSAGSGKTSIALHRSAYLLYRDRKNLTADNILIFSPNEVFAEYISDVLPELGESNVKQTTFQLYSNKFLPQNYLYESKNEHLDYIYSNNNDLDSFKSRTKSMEYKNSLEFMNVLDKFLDDIPKLITTIKPITIDGITIISKESVEKIFFRRFNHVSFLNRIEVIKSSLFSQVENKYLSDRENKYFDFVEDKKTFYDYCKEEVNNQVSSMINTLDTVFIYKLLWSNIQKYSKDDLEDIKNLTLNFLLSKKVMYEDIAPIIYIRAALENYRAYGNIKHILIDEAQDYSPLFYTIIKKSFPNASITIMGDLNQRIDIHSNVKSKDNIISIFDDVRTVILTKSYRSTYNITTFTKNILNTREPIEAVERLGDNPKIYLALKDLDKKIYNIITNMKSKGYKSIAIICKNKESCQNIFDILSVFDEDINLIISDNCDFKVGVNVITSYLAKGLEFDGVILADGQNYLNAFDANLFYTSCTRALHELHIFSNTSLESILPKDKSLYTKINE